MFSFTEAVKKSLFRPSDFYDEIRNSENFEALTSRLMWKIIKFVGLALFLMFLNAAYHIPAMFPGMLPEFGLKTILLSVGASLAIMFISYCSFMLYSWFAAKIARWYGSTASTKEALLAFCISSCALFVYYFGFLFFCSVLLALVSSPMTLAATVAATYKSIEPFFIMWAGYLLITLFMKVTNFKAVGAFFTANALSVVITVLCLFVSLFAIPAMKSPNPAASTQYQQSAESIEKNIDEQLQAIMNEDNLEVSDFMNTSVENSDSYND